MRTRRSLAAIALVALVVTSGCIGFVSGDEPLEYEAQPVDVTAQSASATGYERTARAELAVERTVANRTVTVSNWYARYEKDDEIAEETTGVFAVLSTHRVDVFGRTTNPYATMDHETLLTNVTSHYDTEFAGLEDPTFVENRTVTVLEREATVGVFEATTEFEGETVEMKLYVTRVQHGDDYVIALGGHPTKLPAGERDILSLISGIEHDAAAGVDERIAARERFERTPVDALDSAGALGAGGANAVTPPPAERIAPTA